ncbi:MAG TPA: protein kinase [Candidatus Angelobacter sp.]|nr:protein kinase [Candidatus Angelobacter sp.]
MTPSRWELVTKLFDAALDKPASERMDFVHCECHGDLELELQVKKLLVANERAGSFLEQPWLSTGPVKPRLDDSPLLSPGAVISHRFEIIRMLGQGGMGQVYEAFDLELGERVALKAIRPEISSDLRALSRFRREVQLTRRVTHPNICRTFDIDHHTITESAVQSEITFLTMELLEGETLADFLRRTGKLRTVDALPLVLQMIEALSAAHSAGIVHRDFKPSNILLISSDTTVRAVVTDFGLARTLSLHEASSAESFATSFTGSWELLGTLVYMAPEQIERGEATVSSDIYSLGLVLFEMVTGRRPFFDSVPFSEAVKRIKEPAPSPREFVPDLDPRWEAAIRKCLEVQPKNRFESVSEVAELATSNKPGFPTSAAILQKPGKQTVTQPSDSYRSKRWLRKATLTAGICVAVVVSLFFVLLRLYEKKADPKVASGATVLLTEIQNSTGDKRFDSTTELLRRQLLQSPYFNLMDSDRLKESLEEMRQPADSSLSPSTARGIALRNGAPRIIFGAVSRVGGRYVLDIEIERPDNDTRRARAQWENHWTWNAMPESSQKEIPGDFLDAIRDSGDWIRTQVGESVNDIARINAPPQDITTDNWNALSEFVNAEKFKADGEAENAVVALHNAITSDPHFALAYTRLGDVLVSLGRLDEGYSAYQSALAQEQQQRLTRREKDRLAGIYASDTEDFKTAESVFRDYSVYYPNDYLGWFYQAYPLMMLGHPEEGIARLEKAVAIDPQKMFAPALIARIDLLLGSFGDASKWIRHLQDHGHKDDADLIQGESDFLQGQYDQALNQFAKLQQSSDPHYRSYSFALQVRVYAELGQYHNALDVLEHGIREDVKTGDVAQQASKLLDRAYINLKLENFEACLADIRKAASLEKSPQNWLTAVVLMGQAAAKTQGSLRNRLTREIQKIETQALRQELGIFSHIARARVRGEVFLAEGAWRQAVDEFRRASQLEAPAKDKGYLARGLVTAARHMSDRAVAARMRKEALIACRNTASRPGLVWQWALSYSPGYLSDETLSCVQIAYDGRSFDDEAKVELRQYMHRRSRANQGLRDVEEAKRLASSTKVTVPNN